MEDVYKAITRINNDIEELKNDLRFIKNLHNDVIRRLKNLEMRYEKLVQNLETLRQDIQKHEQFVIDQIIQQSQRIARLDAERHSEIAE